MKRKFVSSSEDNIIQEEYHVNNEGDVNSGATSSPQEDKSTKYFADMVLIESSINGELPVLGAPGGSFISIPSTSSKRIIKLASVEPPKQSTPHYSQSYESDEEDTLERAIKKSSDHCYANKKDCASENDEKDPFDVLQEVLGSVSEPEAREIVREKLDEFKDIFKKHLTEIRQLLQTKKKVDRKVKTLTRVLCSSFREQYIRYYRPNSGRH